MNGNGTGPKFCGQCKSWLKAAEIAIEGTHLVDCTNAIIDCPKEYGFDCKLYSQPLGKECKREHVDKSYISF